MMQNLKKGKTYILVRPYFMADYILEGLKGCQKYEIFHHKRKKGILAKTIRLMANRFPRLLRFRFVVNGIFKEEYVAGLQKISAEDKVILWAVENEKDILILSHLLPTRNITSFLWDPMRQVIHNSQKEAIRYPVAMRNAGIRVCTFDRKDAERYGFEFVGQVYRMPESQCKTNTKTSDVFFVGADKGRAKMLAQLAEYFRENDIKYDFKLLEDRHSKFDDHTILKGSVISHPISYSDTLGYLENTNCILDILQPDQSGVTIRSMEALFYGKKLITNNPNIKEEDFYDPNRIFILGEDNNNGRNLKQFILNCFPEKPTLKVLESHEIRTWVDRLT